MVWQARSARARGSTDNFMFSEMKARASLRRKTSGLSLEKLLRQNVNGYLILLHARSAVVSREAEFKMKTITAQASDSRLENPASR
jgi:hypothetical protein